MQPAERRRAVAAATAVASSLGLAAEDAVVLNDSNRLVVRLLPCDVVARVSLVTHFGSAEREVELARRLHEQGSPVTPLEPRVEPRVHGRDGFHVSLWTALEPVDRALPPEAYAQTLARLHAGLRRIDLATGHFLDRIDRTEREAGDPDATPDLTDPDRALLTGKLRELRRSIVERRAPEQLLHGEPHPWTVLDTTDGPLLMDFENTCRGPVEYDLAWVPEAVAARYPGADLDLVDRCRGVVVAIIAMHRWSRGDEHPSGRMSGVAYLEALRAGPPWSPMTVQW